ncbi:hypothetical protein HPB49_002323 [Dermacentor silvarum]|uniref:Uncharacterized protein n=1 Tax=Dermacentor silvarum TaxID=543639 RepID=A0ACB8C0Z4_DERSI|nr:hypothetical protein HPB49_002323 [Dermacentor silvarum]
MDASLLCASATAREELWPLPWMQLSDADAVVTSMFSAQKIGCNQQPMVNIGGGVLVERSVLDRLQAHCHGLPTKFARNLLRHVFEEAELQGKSLYGKGTNRHKEDTVKEGLDPVRLNAVIDSSPEPPHHTGNATSEAANPNARNAAHDAVAATRSGKTPARLPPATKETRLTVQRSKQLPPLPHNAIRVVVRLRGELPLLDVPTPRLTKAVQTQLRITLPDDFCLRTHPTRNTFIMATAHFPKAETLKTLTSLAIGDQTYPCTAYVAPPPRATRGVITNAYDDETPTQTVPRLGQKKSGVHHTSSPTHGKYALHPNRLRRKRSPALHQVDGSHPPLHPIPWQSGCLYQLQTAGPPLRRMPKPQDRSLPPLWNTAFATRPPLYAQMHFV